MNKHRSKHKLAAIFYADVAEYSRLTGQDELGTHHRVMETLDFASNSIKSNGGVVLRYAGDAILAEFSSVVAAVNTAISIQTELHQKTLDVPEDLRVRIRIGVNLGEVLEDRGEIFGDGVNTAARLESISSPGGLCVSGQVYEQIMGKLDIEFHDGGLKTLKNITAPVHVYQWHPNNQGKSSASPSGGVSPRKIPSIAVLPFVNMSGDLEQDYLADGICEDIITALSKIRVFTVIARTSTFSYKGKSPDVKQVATDLGVSYVLEGSVRKSGNRVRITAQLIDHEGLHIWAEKYDRVIEDIFELQDEMTQTIAAAIEPELNATERQRAVSKSPNNLNAWENYQRGLWNLWLFDDKIETARGFFQKAADLDPGFSTAIAYQAYLNFLQVVMGFSEDHERWLEEGKCLAQKAMETDPRDPVGYFAIGRIYMMLGAHDDAIAALKTALELNPNYAQAYFGLGFVQTLAGDLEDARKNLKIAVRLSPRDPLMMAFTNILGVACITAGDYEEAVEWSKRSLRWPSPLGYWNHATLAAAYAGLDRIEEAKKALQGALNVRQDLSIAFLKRQLPTRHEDGLDQYWKGIRKAGLPE